MWLALFLGSLQKYIGVNYIFQLHPTVNFIKSFIFVFEVQFRMRNQNSEDQFQFMKVTTNTISFLSAYQNKENLNY